MQSIFNTPIEIILLVFCVGFIGSAINAFAGGGTFLAFPALLTVGLDPLIANATSKFAFIPGNLTAAWAYRHYFLNSRKIIVSMLLITFIGGACGALLTLYIGNEKFKHFIPWLIFGATLISWYGNSIIKSLQKSAKLYMTLLTTIFSYLLLGLTSLYGGFFGAGIGVLLIATLNLQGITDIHMINAIKNTISIFINLVAIIMYIIWGCVDWKIAIIQTCGAMFGGYSGGLVGRSLNPYIVKISISVIGLWLSIFYFYKFGYFNFLMPIVSFLFV
jgi:uncharacterized membrane protein YfcA